MQTIKNIHLKIQINILQCSFRSSLLYPFSCTYASVSTDPHRLWPLIAQSHCILISLRKNLSYHSHILITSLDATQLSLLAVLLKYILVDDANFWSGRLCISNVCLHLSTTVSKYSFKRPSIANYFFKGKQPVGWRYWQHPER